jgi:hypothetical protein
VAAVFGTSVATACREQPGEVELFLEMSGLKPMREEGQRSFSVLMRELSRLRLSSTTVVTSSHLTKLQLMRLATESGANGDVQWMSRANELGRNA